MTDDQIATPIDPLKEKEDYERWLRFPQNRGKTIEEFRALPSQQKPVKETTVVAGGTEPAPQKTKKAVVKNGLFICPHCGKMAAWDYIDFYDTLPAPLKAEFTKEVSLVMSLIKTEADPRVVQSWVERYVMLGMRLKYELVSHRDTKDLTAAIRGLAEDLEIITPRSRRIAGRKTDETLSEALTRRVKAAQATQAERPRIEAEAATLVKPLPTDEPPQDLAPEPEVPVASESTDEV